MPVPSLNVVGGITAVAALAAVFYFGVGHRDAPAPALVPTHVTAPAPAHVTAPAAPPVAPVVPPSEKKVEPKKAPLKFRTVTKMDCDWVPAVTKDYSKKQITDAAEGYGLTPAQVSALRSCLK